jgi:protoheme ferro-lyase
MQQASLLQQQLNGFLPTEIKVRPAMTYGNPSVDAVLRNLAEGCRAYCGVAVVSAIFGHLKRACV